jgi:hypothetical protein
MRKSLKYLAVGSLVLFGVAACSDLEIVNENDPDAARSLSSAGDVESLIAGSFNTWFNGVYAYGGPGMFLSNAAFQHNAPWSNSGMEKYGRLPRISMDNDVAANNYSNFVRPWYRSYRAISAVANGLAALEDPAIADELGADNVLRIKAFGKFNLGLSHATLAMFYDRGFAVDETTDLNEAQEILDYNALMERALAYFDEAISLSQNATFTLPIGWMQIALSGPELAKVAHSYKARFRAQVARTAAERAAVSWSAVTADVDAGITEDLVPFYDDYNGWSLDVLGYGTYYGWSQMAYFMYGMADQSGDYERWNALGLTEKSYQFTDGEPVLIVTPDLRFPQGTTVDEQRAAKGTKFEITKSKHAGNTWKKPERGVWRWSWYKTWKGREYWGVDGYELDMNQKEIDLTEMRLLKAEALYRSGDKGGAALIVNETRVEAGLNATDAAGLNTSCVPKLPNGSCGDLWEMLKWEKRMETQFVGLAGVPWYFDGRGWGDLWKDTPLQFPVPCQELQVLQQLPCETFGGPGGAVGAPMSTYSFNGEG